MKNRFHILLVTLFSVLSISLHASGTGKLIDVIVNESGVVEALAKRGIQGVPADKVKAYVKNALISLNQFGDKVPTKSQLRRILGTLGGSPDEIKMRKTLIAILDKPSDKVSKDEMVEAVNNLIYLANRYGKTTSAILACAECVSDVLRKNGFRFTMEIIEDKASRQVLQTMGPKDPTDLKKYISSHMNRLKVGDFTKGRKLVAPEEEKTLALFLGLADGSSPASRTQREFIDSIFEVSKDGSGRVNLLDPENPHKLWKLVDKDMSPELMESWTTLLKEVADEGKDQASKKEAFFKVLKKRAGDDPVLNEQVKMIRSKGCYFK